MMSKLIQRQKRQICAPTKIVERRSTRHAVYEFTQYKKKSTSIYHANVVQACTHGYMKLSTTVKHQGLVGGGGDRGVTKPDT